MIRSFKHNGLKRFYFKDDGKLLNPIHIKRIKILLDVLDSANNIQGLNFSGARLHELKGDRKGTWSMHVSGNWRLTFKFVDGYAYEVNLEDYH